jgi:hypothetical protein
VVLWFPINGDGPGGRWPLTARHIATWSEQFEGLDILGQCKQALAWVEANLGRRKTAKGMPQFLVGWFTRTVNKRGTSAAAASTNGRNPNAGHPADEPSWQVECRELGHVPPCGHGMDCFRRQQQERSR